MDPRLTREALHLMDAHQPFVQAMVVRVRGSAPGKPGATMLVRSDGSFEGTIGGAALEEQVKQACRRAFELRRGDLLHFDLAAWKPGGISSLCGGSVDIAIDYTPARPNLLLWGGGHVAKAIADLLPALDFTYSVADDRPEWVGADRFSAAERREVIEPSRLWERFEPTAFTHLYLLGYDTQKDLEVLRACSGRFPGAIGLIASASKRERMFAQLRAAGWTCGAARRIRSPVGLSLGAESPAEIAISVVGELVQEQQPDRHANRSSTTLAEEVESGVSRPTA